MATESPLNTLHQQAEASFLWYGQTPGGAVGDGAPGDPSSSDMGAAVVETFGEIEGEYAALRKGCVVLDTPQCAHIRVRGRDRVEFLNRMVTQELKGLTPFAVREAFWLSRKGRIDADLRLIELPDEMLIATDALVAAAAVASLASFVFSEDVEFTDQTRALHRLALHGPTSAALLAEISEPADGLTIGDLAHSSSPGAAGAAIVRIAGHRVVIERISDTGELGFALHMETSAVGEVYEQILERGVDGSRDAGAGRFRMRPAGWAAYNIARIEAGTPLFNVDFGTSSLPAETGVLDQRVSFTKGCYLGQEVVARMKSLGHPKQTLVGLRVQSVGDDPERSQPVTGALVYSAGAEPGAEARAVGAVTSSTRSPMLGDEIICFAQVRWDWTRPGTDLLVETDTTRAPAKVTDSLTFWQKP